jgi:hypothetical protein
MLLLSVSVCLIERPMNRLGCSNDVDRAMLWEFEVPAPVDGIVSGEMPK